MCERRWSGVWVWEVMLAADCPDGSLALGVYKIKLPHSSRIPPPPRIPHDATTQSDGVTAYFNWPIKLEREIGSGWWVPGRIAGSWGVSEGDVRLF